MPFSPPHTQFALSEKAKAYHIAVHPADASLNPPDSYLFIQTFLILLTALLWMTAYLFYSIRTFRDHKTAMPLYCLYANLAWELFYWIVLASTTFERYGYCAWFLTDLIHAAITIRYEYASQIWPATQRMGLWVCVFMCGFWVISVFEPDHQRSAFWTALVMQVPTSWISLYDVVRGEDVKGHSLEIWFTRTLGTMVAFSAFLWRYVNVPENWAYVVNPWSTAMMVASVLGDILYPIFFIRRKMKKEKAL